jgi:hypothetical protein
VKLNEAQSAAARRELNSIKARAEEIAEAADIGTAQSGLMDLMSAIVKTSTTLKAIEDEARAAELKKLGAYA